MRRQEREIRDEAEIQEILEKGLVCRLGLYDGQYPYVVPLNYGYRNGCMYFHCAREGRKIDILKRTTGSASKSTSTPASYGARRLAGGQQSTGA